MVRGNLTDVETGFQLRSRFVCCDVPETVRLRFSVARALLVARRVSARQGRAGENRVRFEHPAGSSVVQCVGRLSLSYCTAPGGAGVRWAGGPGRIGATTV